MPKKCCADCVYALRPTSHWLGILVRRFFPGLLICFNHPQCPGQMAETGAHCAVCRNFRRRSHGGERPTVLQPSKPGVRYILLTQNKVAMVDPEDFEELNQYTWSSSRKEGRVYACRCAKGKQLLMHRVIMKAPKGMVVDHIDGDGLNNCKANLRLCTREQNTYNCQPRNGCTGFKGVVHDKRSGKYTAGIGYKYDHLWIGDFDDPVEAARARDLVARALQGEHAWLNLPDQRRVGPGAGTVAKGPAVERAVSEETQRVVENALIRAWRKHPRRYVELSGRAACHCHAVANLTVIHGPVRA
jgi:hypothetical protein